MEKDEYQDLIDELQKDYLESLPEKRNKIITFFQNKDWKQVEQEFHRLKGTGKTYGIPEISLLGQEMEALCKVGPNALTLAIKPALSLLKDIQLKYQGSTSQEFDLLSDPRYQSLLNNKT